MAEKGPRETNLKIEGRMINVPHSRPLIDGTDIQAVTRVLHSGQISQGKKVEEFEARVADYIGSRFAVAVSSGTTALYLALLGLDVQRGDEVIVPTYVCPSPYLAILHTGATPRIADISPADYNLCASAAQQVITATTKAIIVPHMFGMPAEIRQLCNLGIPIIEDCAQSLGAEYDDRKAGTFGRVSVFSFYATKMIATGEGGMILTDDRSIYERIRQFRDYDKKAPDARIFNYKMTDMQAALGIAQLAHLDSFIERRRQIASEYSESFSKFGIRLPGSYANKKPVIYRYVVELRRKGVIQQESKNRGVMCENPVWRPLHDILGTDGYPFAKHAHKHALSIPIYPSLTKYQLNAIKRTLCNLFGKYEG